MKRILAVWLAVCVCLTAGCGSSGTAKEEPARESENLQEREEEKPTEDAEESKPEEKNAFVKQLVTGEPETVPPLAADDAERTLTVGFDEDVEAGMGTAYLKLDGARTDVGEFGCLKDAFLLGLADGRQFVILDADYMSDDYVTFVYEITADGPVQTDEVNGLSLQDGSVDPQRLVLQMHLDALGTYRSMMGYTIDEAGKLVQEDELFTLWENDSPYTVMTTVREVPVVIDGQETVLEAGRRIRITATDIDSVALFRDEDDGTEGEIHFTRGDEDGNMWVIYIDGIPDYEYFDGIPYAG